MLQRYLAKCETCDEPFVLRIGVGHGVVQPVVFACPYCETALRGILRVDYKTIKATLKQPYAATS